MTGVMERDEVMSIGASTKREEKGPRILILSHPGSRQNKKSPHLLDQIDKLTSNFFNFFDLDPSLYHGPQPHIFHERCSTLNELKQVVVESLKHEIDICAINGGDGTNHRVISMFIEIYGEQKAALPSFHFLRGGTMNTVARSLGLSRKGPLIRLKMLATSLSKNSKVRALPKFVRPLLRVSYPAQSAQEYGFIVGIGAICKFLEDYYSASDPSPLTGLFTLMKHSARVLAPSPKHRHDPFFSPWKGQIFADFLPIPHHEFLAVAASTVNEIGLGFTPFPEAQSMTDKMQALFCFGPPGRLVLEFPNLYVGRKPRLKNVMSSSVRHLSFRAEQGPISYMIDGDLRTCETDLSISLGPNIGIIKM